MSNNFYELLGCQGVTNGPLKHRMSLHKYNYGNSYIKSEESWKECFIKTDMMGLANSHCSPVGTAQWFRASAVLTFSLCRWSLRATPSPPPCGLPDRQRVAGSCTSRVPCRGPRGGWMPPVVTQRLGLDKEQKGETHPSLQGRVRGG